MNEMRIRMQHADQSSDIAVPNVDLAFVGAAIDARGKAAQETLSVVTKTQVRLQYDAERLHLRCDSEIVECDEFADWLKNRSPRTVLLEATTLGLPEIAMCCRAVKSIDLAEITFLYVEPREYSAPRIDQALHKRDFDLSYEVVGYSAIPGSAFLLEELGQLVVFFCGYEGERLDQAFESLKLNPERCSIVLGVPAFRPGWEMNTFANVLPVIRDREIRGGVAFCGADNPAAARDLLADRYTSKKPDDQMFVAPIGTKPHGIGAALFATEHDDVGLLYDHPLRRSQRTTESGRWHLFVADWSQT
jgi:hypothetical protein